MAAGEELERWDEVPTLVTELSDLYPQLLEDEEDGAEASGTPASSGGERIALDGSQRDAAQLGQARPPALPMPLVRVVRHGDAWLEELPPETRRVLEAVRRGRPATRSARVAEALSGPRGEA